MIKLQIISSVPCCLLSLFILNVVRHAAAPLCALFALYPVHHVKLPCVDGSRFEVQRWRRVPLLAAHHHPLTHIIIPLLVAASLLVKRLLDTFLLQRGAACRPSIRIVLLQLIRGHEAITFKLLHEGVLVASVPVLLIVTADVERLLLTAGLHVSLLLSRTVLRLALLIDLHVLHSPPSLQHQLVFCGEVMRTIIKVFRR